MKKSELTDKWQYALVPVKIRTDDAGHAEALPRGGLEYNTIFVTDAELRHVIPVKRWPTRREIEEVCNAEQSEKQD